MPENNSTNTMSFGITGHRHLTDAGLVRKALLDAVSFLKDRFALQEATVFSPLAQGADRLAVNVFFEVFGNKVGLIVPIPLPLEEYKKDFDTAEDLKEFERYWTDPRMLKHLEPDNEHLGDASNREVRYQAYLDVGKKVADACDILTAVWNGEASKNVGGTGDVVEHARSKNKRIVWIHSENGEIRFLNFDDENEWTSVRNSKK